MTPFALISVATISRIGSAAGRSVFGSVNEMSVAPSAETFCTIMSMLTPASASARKRRAAMPGLSGTASTVAFASEVSCVTPEMIAFSSTRSFSSLIHVPSLSLNAERTWIGTPYLRAISTDLAIITRAPVAAISSISS